MKYFVYPVWFDSEGNDPDGRRTEKLKQGAAGVGLNANQQSNGARLW